MREQYCIYTIEKIRSKPFIRMTEQQEMFRVLYPIIGGTQRVECISKVTPKFMTISFAQSYP